MSDLDTVVAEFNEIREEFQTKIKDKMTAAFANFFATYPEFSSVYWTQYTPYFNDGDSCEFSVGDFYYTVNQAVLNGVAAQEDHTEETDEDEDEVEDEDWEDDDENGFFSAPDEWRRTSGYYKDEVAAYDALSDEKKARYAELDAAWEAFSTSLRKVPEEIFLVTFEDHMKVRVTKDGITVTEYEHD